LITEIQIDPEALGTVGINKHYFILLAIAFPSCDTRGNPIEAVWGGQGEIYEISL
jgi:hypothetical protein